ncbi:MAG: aminotransferase class V-fold PLP-dependent enzyme, partial [Verrucomicrobia bacterium]|nr:aminotransferase class V-fold PLP-dependent enzyme [Verrucomicrobiota bacterium]
MIYLDASATTPVDPRVVEAMLPFLTQHYANPSASYAAARFVKKALDTAREQVAALIDAEPDEIIFTSGGTESDNAAIGSAITLELRRGHFVTVKTEHSAVLETARRWMEYGRPVSEVDVDSGGRVRLDNLREATKSGQTALVSVMWANNETGVMAPMDEIAKIAHERGAMFHTDAVQLV